jgi:DnaJ like chaperone protein
MSKYGPWIGGALGWAFAGPIGGILGFAFGKIFSEMGGASEAPQAQQANRRAQPGDFAAALIVLSAAVMKADDRVMRSELDYVKEFLVKNFGRAQAEQLTSLLRDVLKRPFALREVAEQIRFHMEHPKRLLLLQYLYGIAKADGQVHTKEVEVIRRIATYLGISDKDRASIEEHFYRLKADPYTVLEIAPQASDAEVKKAYRRLAVKFHPDKVGDLGEAHREAAREQFIAVQEAYEQIKSDRGFK